MLCLVVRCVVDEVLRSHLYGFHNVLLAFMVAPLSPAGISKVSTATAEEQILGKGLIEDRPLFVPFSVH